jgi:hypothetical protein
MTWLIVITSAFGVGFVSWWVINFVTIVMREWGDVDSD